MDGGGQGTEAGVGADVGGGLLPADVLLAGGEGEDEAAPAELVHRLARDAAGHLPQVGLAGGEESGGGAAEVQGVAEALEGAGGEVGAQGAGRRSSPSETASLTTATVRAPTFRASAAASGKASSVPRKPGWPMTTQAVSSPRARARASRSVRPSGAKGTVATAPWVACR